MHRPVSRWLLGVCALLLAAGVGRAEDETPDWTMGNWEGEWKAAEGDGGGKVEAKIVAKGGDNYAVHLRSHVKNDEVKAFQCDAVGKRDGDSVRIESKVEPVEKDGDEPEVSIDCTFLKGVCDGTFKAGEHGGTITMKRIFKKSPTLGAAPPEGAVLVFDGKSLDQWQLADGRPAPWKLVDGAMEVAAGEADGKPVRGDIHTKERFTNAKIHVEFKTPFMPKQSGQARGNSGVYLQGRYELQVLDSFGEPPRDNEAGGFYQAAIPRINASLPPGEWQTYDIEFHAPKYDANGKQTKPAIVTVNYNGEVIHDAIELKRPTPGGLGGDPKTDGPLLLQDHGNPMQFRNVWIQKLDS